MQSWIYAARAAFAALSSGDSSAATLASYDRQVRESYLVQDLRKTRNMRLAFKHGFALGGVENGLLTLTGGAFPGWRIKIEEDAVEPRRAEPAEPPVPYNLLAFGKLDAVVKSGNATRDTVRSEER